MALIPTDRLHELEAAVMQHLPMVSHAANVMDSALNLTVADLHGLIARAKISPAEDETAVKTTDMLAWKRKAEKLDGMEGDLELLRGALTKSGTDLSKGTALSLAANIIEQQSAAAAASHTASRDTDQVLGATSGTAESDAKAGGKASTGTDNPPASEAKWDAPGANDGPGASAGDSTNTPRAQPGGVSRMQAVQTQPARAPVTPTDDDTGVADEKAAAGGGTSHT